MTLLCKFKRIHPSVDEEEVEFMETTEQYFNSSLKIILSPLYINRIFCDMVNQIDNNVEIFERNGSGWILDEVKGCDIRTAQFEILKGGCSCIIPSHLKNKNAIVNPDNKENDCFVLAFLICMHGDSVDNRHRGIISQYEKFKTHYDFSSLKFPTSLKDIIAFEKRHKHIKIGINVFGIDQEEQLNVLRLTPHANSRTHKIVYIQDAFKQHGHYMSILNFSRLINRQGHHRKFVCYNCLNTFGDEKRLDSHQQLCFEFKTQKVSVPSVVDGKIPFCSFESKKLSNKLKCNFVIYGDFEAMLTDDNTSTTSIDKHKISGYNLAVIGPNKKLVHISKYRGPNSIDKFIDEESASESQVNLQASFCIQRNKIHIAMKQLSLEEEYDFSMADSCHICEHDFDHQSIKVRDHDHNTGLFRGAAHRECNAS
ncbi:uncharacterized protein LOC110860887 [Folsomia candida]|uniref:uncharacterized protein LOC110860887 n=1 Tax=Folsomia candida TaxID=158441 RepID=UPI000B8FF155|nr:uncharacterized protein LOC110860887 [Folsomia candida]XP_035716548.1 uncharacterized protein LOC110860887 [Folsomia candida]XP_035716549.1 uncharacterized protein LOC110860887 [Folsomia candida]XP_035716550.1 uncharacterized protein LOC110860887 [Folsomia candida]XP_035716551.1 uncharacterized protein LOC110860887 [Folsomia candida]XP_035716552.1 uncharacterized protein LOC110860887 [Folsomia candida]XP_035716553.1 uncharacterized protein LOC110860887 [Folsomia candida]XP_035716554.1 unc